MSKKIPLLKYEIWKREEEKTVTKLAIVHGHPKLPLKRFLRHQPQRSLRPSGLSGLGTTTKDGLV